MISDNESLLVHKSHIIDKKNDFISILEFSPVVIDQPHGHIGFPTSSSQIDDRIPEKRFLKQFLLQIKQIELLYSIYFLFYFCKFITFF